MQDKKDLYEIGEIPPLGHIPKQMYAWLIRQERHGEPRDAMKIEIVDAPKIGENDVLVMVMAAGVNYNGVWASLGKPVSPFDFHIAGSDASGIIWAVGPNVKRWKVGDEVVIHCNQVDGDDEECNGGDPMLSSSQKIWGYETPDGSFAQFTAVQQQQIMHRPKHLTWEESGCYVLCLATAYRMLYGHQPHTLKPGQNVLVWGASGGLGVFATQLIKHAGANAIGVVSSDDKINYVKKLGAVGAINRKNFQCWGELPNVDKIKSYTEYSDKVKEFGKAIWEFTGKGISVDTVFDHPGGQTFPVSCFVVKRGGMVVYCAATSGYNLTFDARYGWMHQKRIQGSHFATLKQAYEANNLVINKKIQPCMSEVLMWDKIPEAHMKIRENKHKPGNIAVLVQAKKAGLKTV